MSPNFKYWSALLILFLFPFNCFGQTSSWQFFVTAGGSLNRFSGKDAQSSSLVLPQFFGRESNPYGRYYIYFNGGNQLMIGYNGGFGINKILSESLSAQLKVLSGVWGGAIKSVDQAPQVFPSDGGYDPSTYAIDGNRRTNFHLEYIKVPLTIKFFPLKRKAFFLSPGLYYSQLLHAEETGYLKGRYYHYILQARQGVADSLDVKYKTPDAYRNNDFGLIFGVGYYFSVIHRKDFCLQLEFSQGTENVSAYTGYAIVQFYNQSYSLELSWYFKK